MPSVWPILTCYNFSSKSNACKSEFPQSFWQPSSDKNFIKFGNSTISVGKFTKIRLIFPYWFWTQTIPLAYFYTWELDFIFDRIRRPILEISAIILATLPKNNAVQGRWNLDLRYQRGNYNKLAQVLFQNTSQLNK